jgi:hypothetical protein
MAIARWLVGAVGVVSGLISALIGRSAGTPARPGVPMQGMVRKVVAVTGMLFVVCLVITLSWGDTALGTWITGDSQLFDFYGDQIRHPSNVNNDSWMLFCRASRQAGQNA